MSNIAEFTIHVHGAHVIQEGPGFHPIKRTTAEDFLKKRNWSAVKFNVFIENIKGCH
jgi:hypothetical protein